MARIPPNELAAMRLDDHDERPTIIAVCVVSITLAYIAVVMRIVARWKARARLEADDWLIATGLATTTGFIVASFFMVRYGLGLNIVKVIDSGSIEPFVKSVIAAQVLYSASIIPVKLSILYLYHRLFPARLLYKLSIATAILIASYAIVQALCFIFQCVPMSSLWTGLPGRCIDFNAMVTSMGVLNVFTDFVLVLLPIPYLWGLRLDRTKKTQLIGTFLLGGVVCVFGILRAVFVGTADPKNPSRSYLQGAMWSVLEINVGIVSACLPTLRPLFRARVLKAPTGSNSYGVELSGRRHSNAPMPSKVKAAAAFNNDDSRPFARLDDAESAKTHNVIEEIGTLSRSQSSSRSRTQSRSESRAEGGSRSRDNHPRERGDRSIVVTTDINVREY